MEPIFIGYGSYDGCLAKVKQRSSDDPVRPDGLDIYYGGDDGDGPGCGRIELDSNGRLTAWAPPQNVNKE